MCIPLYKFWYAVFTWFSVWIWVIEILLFLFLYSDLYCSLALMLNTKYENKMFYICRLRSLYILCADPNEFPNNPLIDCVFWIFCSTNHWEEGGNREACYNEMNCFCQINFFAMVDRNYSTSLKFVLIWPRVWMTRNIFSRTYSSVSYWPGLFAVVQFFLKGPDISTEWGERK